MIRRFGVRLALVTSSLLLVFAVGELAVRWATAHNRSEVREARAALERAEGPLRELTGAETGRRNIRGVHKGVLVRTDEHGFRGPPRDATPAPGVVRIVMTGDSFTFGAGVEEEDAYASRLAQELAAARPEAEYEVINAGLSGANIAAVLRRLETAIDAYDPDLYVYGLTLNDIEGRHYELAAEDERSRAWLSWAAGQPSKLIEFVTWQLFTLEGLSAPAEARYPRELRRNYLENPAAWARIERGLDRYAALAAKAGVCAHLLLHTQLSTLDDEHPFLPLYTRVAEAARARGLTVTEPFPAFEGRTPRSLWVSAVDPHPNAAGHALLAERLTRDLVALPRDCWTR